MNAFFQRIWHCSSAAPGSYTVLSDPRNLVAIATLYLISIFGLKAYCRNGAANFAYRRGFIHLASAHNLLLCVLSLIMNVGATTAVVRTWKEEGPAATVCTRLDTSSSALPPDFQFWMYMFFLSKFYELLDTVLLVLRGRPLTLLHVWHHVSVMFETWGWLTFGVTVGIYGMWFNCFVHIIMYAYYAAALLKMPFPLKKGITTIQIVQFVTGFLSLIPYSYLHISGPGCTGVVGLAISAAINGSYLLLFLRFFKKTYSKKE